MFQHFDLCRHSFSNKNPGKSHKAGSRVNPTVTAGVGKCFFTAFPYRDKLNITKLYIYIWQIYANLQYSASDQLFSWLMNVITKKLTTYIYIYSINQFTHHNVGIIIDYSDAFGRNFRPKIHQILELLPNKIYQTWALPCNLRGKTWTVQIDLRSNKFTQNLSITSILPMYCISIYNYI